jgi:phosphoribosylaminoimidazole-succinocarboxamide synthase
MVKSEKIENIENNLSESLDKLSEIHSKVVEPSTKQLVEEVIDHIMQARLSSNELNQKIRQFTANL